MSRTGTGRWKTLRRRMLVTAVRRGEFRCAECGIDLDPSAVPYTRHAGELDHIVPVSVAPEREFDPSNLRWLCHFHNRQRGGRIARPLVPTTRRW